METFEKLDPEFKAKWVAELRSGKHKQGKYIMYNPAENSLCCLAVAAVITGIDKKAMAKMQIMNYADWGEDHFLAVTLLAIENGYPKQLTCVKDQANIFDADGATAGHVLAKMNDGGKSFPEIADWIEANL